MMPFNSVYSEVAIAARPACVTNSLQMCVISKTWITASARCSLRFRTFKIHPKDVVCVCRQSQSVTRVHRKQGKGHVMNHVIRKADQERLGWSRPPDNAWAAGCRC